LSRDAVQGAGARHDTAAGDGDRPDLVRRLKISLIAAAIVPTLFFAGAAWIFAARHPEATPAASRGELATLALLTLAIAAGLMSVAWSALRRARQAFEHAETASLESAQRMRAEHALLQAQKLEALGRLTGGVAHDFNNLLMIINNNAYLLRRGDATAPVAPRLAAIERAVESGTKLTRQLLAFSRRQAVNPELIRLQDELPELVELMRPALGSRVSVKTDVEAGTAPVRADRAGLELALLNLAVNAGDAMPDRGELTVTVKNASPGAAPGLEGDFVVLSVSDTGVGIPEDVQQRVFEPFFSTKPIGKGTGLGLSQVYGFCQQSGGTVTIESQQGLGTTVRMYLPASSETVKEKDEPPQPFQGEALRHRVLIVEDNDDVAETTRQLLEFLGCEVRRVESGNAAVLRLERDARNFDLVLTDIVMPGGLSGIEVLRYVRDRHPHLPVVLMTGYSNELQNVSPDEIVLLKPFSPPELADALRKALARREEAGSTAQ
jgi:signal transduction histidine kinase/ActR/RegA family two-component response regulator